MDSLVIPAPTARWRHGIKFVGQNEIGWSEWSENLILHGWSDWVGSTIAYNTASHGGLPVGFAVPFYIAIGQGMTDGTWDFVQGPPAPIDTLSSPITQLVSEVARLPANTLGWRDDPPQPLGAGAVEAWPAIAGFPVHTARDGSGILTSMFSRPILTVNWPTTFHGVFREIGLFAGIRGANDATVTNGGIMLNVFRFSQISKQTTDTAFTLYWEVEFNIKWS